MGVRVMTVRSVEVPQTRPLRRGTYFKYAPLRAKQTSITKISVSPYSSPLGFADGGAVPSPRSRCKFLTESPYSSPCIRPRLSFDFRRSRFVSTIRRFCARLFGRLRRRSFSTAARRAASAWRKAVSSFSQSSCQASSRFAACERSRCTRTSTPVGPWRRQTVEDVLLIF